MSIDFGYIKDGVGQIYEEEIIYRLIGRTNILFRFYDVENKNEFCNQFSENSKISFCRSSSEKGASEVILYHIDKSTFNGKADVVVRASIKTDLDYDCFSGEMLSNEEFKDVSILIFCNSTKDADAFFQVFGTPKVKEKNAFLGKISVLFQQDDELVLKSISKPEESLDLDNYCEDFKEANDKIISSLKEKSKGIILLHGLPGTGKSTYLKFLPSLVGTKSFIFIPPNFGDILSSPKFLTFMANYKNSVLIIEDAETVLQTRKGGQNHAVSNILNLTDGLLSDLLQIQVICTLNCNVNMIDDAIRRPGRLLCEYEFKKLSKEKSQLLLKKHYPEKEIVVKSAMSIAEIYNVETNILKDDQSIGFKANG
jgi:hypothetical protein